MKPLLKWAGGKRWLLPVLNKIWAPHATLKLVEPFAGGLAVALGLNPKKALLNDANVHLINFYQQVKSGLHVAYELQNDEKFYYAKRERFNFLIEEKKHMTPEAAVIFYYLIRTGFNGLCRFNSNGKFNVPFGQHNSIRYKTDFLEYKMILQPWQFKNGDFINLKLTGDEFIYADPPYDVDFTRYVAKDFIWSDQIRLANWLVKHNGPVVASNQATKRIKELYLDLGFTVYLIEAPRMIACNGNRTLAKEILAFKNVQMS